jgi:Mn2+/Fe2+ NRAMP family transporter
MTSNTTTINGDMLDSGTSRGRVVRSKLSRRLWTFLVVVGPGLIVMEADNDAGALSTYTQAGADYGLKLLWLLLLLLPVCYLCQEMVARLGIVTGEGHAAMIYKRFGKWWGRFSLFDLQLVNFFTLVTEFAAIDLVAKKVNMSPVVAVSLAAFFLLTMVLTSSYRRWEWITVGLCLFDLAWVISAFVCKPPAGEVLHNTLVPVMPVGGITGALVFLVIAIVGTTIAPWQLFFQQSCVADKRLRLADLKYARVDTFLGATFTVIVAGCMMVAGYTLSKHGVKYEDPAQMAVALGSFMGPGVRNVLLLLCVNAAILGSTAISLSSAWAYGEVRGCPASLQLSFSQAPVFYSMYVLCVLAAASLVLIPNAPLQLIILGVQVLAGIMLPSAIIFLQLLLNDKEVLGEQYVNKRWNNIANWIIIGVLFTLSLVLAVQVIFPDLFPK